MINYILTYEDLFFVIVSVCLFFQGFYFGRRQMLRLSLISLVMVISSITSIVIHGKYSLDVTIFDVIAGIIYVSFLWGVGYVMSHIIEVKETDIAKVKRLNIEGEDR